MNAIKLSRFICGHIKRHINVGLEKSVRCYGSGGKLVNVVVNPKTGIYTVSFDRPPVNSLNLELINEFIFAMMTIEKDGARGMIVTSDSPGIFTAGLDLMELYKPNQDRLKAYWTALQDMWLKLYGSGYSTVAAISGHAPGGGCLVSISCDYRIMVKGSYRIGLNETKIGLVAPSWFIDTFRNILPFRLSEKALISGKLFNVEEALSVGLIDEVASDQTEAIAKAEEYLGKLKNFSKKKVFMEAIIRHPVLCCLTFYEMLSPPLASYLIGGDVLSAFAIGQTKLTIRYDVLSRLRDNRENDLRVFINFINSSETQRMIDMYVQSLKV